MRYRYVPLDHHDDDGRHIREFVVTKGDPPEDFVKFMGIGVVEVELGDRTVPRQFNTAIDAEDIDEAFEKYDEIMSKAAPIAKKQLEIE